MSRAIAVALLALAPLANAVDRSRVEDARIEYLLGVIASLHDAQFIRNGTAYDSTAAVKHLRTKLGVARSHVKTADDFIRYCASQSSVSGNPMRSAFTMAEWFYPLTFRGNSSSSSTATVGANERPS